MSREFKFHHIIEIPRRKITRAESVRIINQQWEAFLPLVHSVAGNDGRREIEVVLVCVKDVWAFRHANDANPNLLGVVPKKSLHLLKLVVTPLLASHEVTV